MIKEYNTFIKEIFTRPKNVPDETPSILFINGSRPWFNKTGALNINRRKQSTSNILTQFGHHLIYGDVYWRGGETIFDEMMEIIESKNIVALVGNSAGGYISFFLSNKYKIPAMSINPAMASTSEAPILQPLPPDVKSSPLFPKQLVIAGDKDSKAKNGVDMKMVIKDLKSIGFEEKGGKILILKNTYHRISSEQFDSAFKHFYKKYMDTSNNYKGGKIIENIIDPYGEEDWDYQWQSGDILICVDAHNYKKVLNEGDEYIVVDVGHNWVRVKDKKGEITPPYPNMFDVRGWNKKKFKLK